jgi:peptidoglycan hydrolase-like protein with peptidoglycan-binding domain
MNKAQAIAAVVKAAESQLNYNPGRTYSKYGQWYGWPNALWCACGASWSFYQALGSSDAKRVIGFQADGPNRRGWAWTVAWRAWLLANGGVKVGPNKAEPGDIMFFKYPTSDGRNSNVVNHVDLVVGHFNTKGQYVPTIGFNTPKPGSGGDPSNGRGVWRQKRDRHDPYIECVIRPPWHKLTPAPFQPHGRTTKQVQAIVGVTVDGDYGPTTKAAVKTHQAELKALGYATGTPDGLWGKDTNDAQEKYMTEIAKLTAEVQALRAEVRAIPTAEQNASALLGKTLYGKAVHWWIRGGRIDDPTHKQFPYDEGSPYALQVEAARKQGVNMAAAGFATREG